MDVLLSFLSLKNVSLCNDINNSLSLTVKFFSIVLIPLDKIPQQHDRSRKSLDLPIR